MTNENEKTIDDGAVETEAPPTLAEVEREERKARELAERVDEIGPEIETYEAEIAEALADGDEESARRLRASRRELIELRSDLEAATEVLEARANQRREEATRAMAETRLDAIGEEHETGEAQLREDVDAFAEAARLYAAAAAEVAETYEALTILEAEADALTDRFRGLARPKLGTVAIPFRRDEVTDALKTVQRARSRIPDRAPKRVSIDVTPGAEIIDEAGPRPLTAEEKAEAEAEAERERKREEQRRRAEAELSRFGAGVGSRTG